MAWQLLGGRKPSQLEGARAQAHWAAQLIAAAGETYLPALPDTSHTAMTWEAAEVALVGRRLPGDGGFRVALRVPDLALLLLLGDAGSALAELPLAGCTLAEARRFVSAAVKQHTRAEREKALVHPDFALDPHPLGRGATFECDAGLPELARWYANADEALRRFADETPGAGEVLCWPHHFDIASLVDVESDADGNALRTVGVGLSPGDDSIALPYWYVNHEPTTQQSELPALAAGEWFTRGFIGAVLRGSELVDAGDVRAQEALLRRYLAAAFAASRELTRAAPLDP